MIRELRILITNIIVGAIFIGGLIALYFGVDWAGQQPWSVDILSAFSVGVVIVIAVTACYMVGSIITGKGTWW